MLKPGDIAPLDIELEGSDECKHTLRSFEGSRLVVFFYPKDNTPGCTAECISLSALYHEIQSRGCQIVGISPDSVASHQKFIEKHHLKMLLLSDPNHELTEAFGAWGLKKTFGKEYMGLLRSTFILDADGKVEYVFDKVKTKTHGEEVLAVI